jgi:hypothetical protein
VSRRLGESCRASGGLAQLCLGGQRVGLGLGDPLADLLGIAAGVERRAVAGHLGRDVLDPSQSRLPGCVIRLGLLAGHDLVDGASEVSRGEYGGEPLVDLDVEGVLPEVDVARVADLVGQVGGER